MTKIIVKRFGAHTLNRIRRAQEQYARDVVRTDSPSFARIAFKIQTTSILTDRVTSYSG